MYLNCIQWGDIDQHMILYCYLSFMFTHLIDNGKNKLITVHQIISCNPYGYNSYGINT